ncbi:MAG TPA: hypothetical protein VHR45_07195 [Thermoanaerobaculia bacterium]|nr:hypothetical protein [Thermoanaerobaculia bacterium]
MQMTKALLAVTLAALGMSGCNGSPTAPDPNTPLNTYIVFADLVNVSGAPTILDAQLLLDGVVVEEKTFDDVGGVADALLADNSAIFAGRHTLTLLLARQTTSLPTTYRVPKFDFHLLSCNEGSLGYLGPTTEDLHLPTQTASLTAGQGISYTFYTPECSVPQALARPSFSRRSRSRPTP